MLCVSIYPPLASVSVTGVLGRLIASLRECSETFDTDYLNSLGVRITSCSILILVTTFLPILNHIRIEFNTLPVGALMHALQEDI